MDVAILAVGIIAAIAASATLVYLVRNGRPSPTVHLQADPASGNLGPRPASVFSLRVTNNGGAPLRVTAALLLNGREAGEFLDGGRAARTATIAVGQTHGWAIAVEADVLARDDAPTVTASASFRWLLVPRSLIVERGERASF